MVKLDFLDFDPDLPLDTFVENRDVGQESEENAFLQFLPGMVGVDEADEGLDRYDDSFLMLEDVY
ncbi:uncharacterized protein N7484_001520 [Penicillium longicatenatum]|uniref:uncharacterized protein n=1 Tax=Penicillium longicatenatum TaxID=1561947 RepID=UPI0025473CA4|nr:uncharacterized protein N7484_001520 [Penicillium longicatenatum]KAJ5657871.1 hypothetical protein N7484_001520 [Penicillium longicatenatum]